MLEIIALLIFSERISAKARLKGYPNTGRFVLLFILMWLGFEIMGATLSQFVTPNPNVRWITGFVFAFIGAYLSFVIVGSLKTKEIPAEYDPEKKIEPPFAVNLLKENLVAIVAICGFSAVMIYYLSYYLLFIPLLIFLFTKYGIYTIVFHGDRIVLTHLYGRRRTIANEKIVRAVLNTRLQVEVHWKKSAKHSTKSIKFAANAFLAEKIPLENIKRFLRETYSA